MRMVAVWVLTILICLMVGISWYATLPAVLGISHALNSTYYGDANARNIATAVEYASFAWGPVLICFVLLWATVSSSRYDQESVYYG